MNKLLCTLLLTLLLATSATAQTKKDRFAAADEAVNAKKLDEAAQLFGEIGDDPKMKLEDRTRALTRQADLLRQLKKYDEAVTSLQKQLALPNDVARQKQLTLTIADMQVAGGKLDAGVATLTELAAKYPDDVDTITQALLTAAAHLGREKQFARSGETYQAAFKAMGADDPRAADTLWNVSQQYFVAEQYDKSIAAAEQLLDERYRPWPRGQNGEANERIAAALGKLKKPAEAMEAFRKWETSDPNPLFRSRWCLRVAQTAAGAGDQAKAREAYRRLMIDHAGNGTTEGWYDAQVSHIDGLVAANQLPEALKHLHVLFDAAADQGQLTGAVQRMADLLQKVDGNKKRAKDLVNGLLFGPTGKDGKPGNLDDNKEVLSTIGYPDDAERKAAFAKAFAAIGDDAAATFHRAQLCIYSGHPQQALALYADATRRAGHAEWATYANALVMNGLRVARGSSSGLDDAAKFLLSGEGDNPFKDAPAAGSTPWPVPALSPADKQNVTAVMNALQQIAIDRGLGADSRTSALRGFARTVETLGVAPSAEPFYPLLNEPEPQSVREQATAIVLRLERGGELHVGKVKTFLAADSLPQQAQKRTDAEFKRTIKPLEKLTAKNASSPKLTPMKD